MPSTLDDGALHAVAHSGAAMTGESTYAVDRRRPGRIDYASPHLIALLRRSHDGSEAFTNLRDVPYRPATFSPWPMIWMTVLSGTFWVAAAAVLGLLR